jgi:hypothetical protein
MATLAPPQPRSTILDEGGGLKIIMRPNRQWFVIMFVLAWMVGWWFGFTQALSQLQGKELNRESLFLMAWLAMWTLGGGWVIAYVLWTLFGRHVVTIDFSVLLHRREVFGAGITRAFHVHEMRNLRPSAVPASGSRRHAEEKISVAFDYGAKTIHLGTNCFDEAEAVILVERIRQRFPGLAPQA